MILGEKTGNQYCEGRQLPSNFCKLYVEFIQQSGSLHHSRSWLVRSAKQCQDPWSWPSVGSMNCEKFVYQFLFDLIGQSNNSFLMVSQGVYSNPGKQLVAQIKDFGTGS